MVEIMKMKNEYHHNGQKLTLPFPVKRRGRGKGSLLLASCSEINPLNR